MAFIETPRFPDDIAYDSSFQTVWATSVISSQSGFEARNQMWAQARKRFDIGYGIKTITQLYEVIKYFEAVQGRTHGFRFKDPTDFKSTGPDGTPTHLDIVIGTGNASNTDFQLAKDYVKGTLTTTRNIKKPVNGTILIGLNGSLQTETTHYTIDYSTGIVTFNTPPPNGQSVTWGGEFDVPVRFDQDQLEVDIHTLEHGALSIPLVELRA